MFYLGQMQRPDGSIRLVDGVWKVRVTLTNRESGKRRQKQITCHSEAEAQAALATLLAERDGEKTKTVGFLLNEYHAHTRTRRSPRSDNEVQRLIKHLKPIHGWLLSEVTAGKLERFYHELQTSHGYSNGTIRHIHYVVSPAMRLADRWGWIDSNPAEQVELGDLNRATVKLPDDNDILKLIEECNQRPPLGLFVRLALVTGARRGELSALRWDDIDWTGPTLTIQSALSEIPGAVLRKEPKTAASVRRLGIDPETLTVLASHREAADSDYDYIFGGEKPISPSSWSARFGRASAAAGVKMRLHDLRHWSASSLIAAGVPINAISARLGHARTSTTTDIYGHLLAADDTQMAKLVMERLTK